jgi:ABC-type lipoprotein release transport system permease subunit
MRSLLFGMSGIDPATCAVVALATLTVTVLAALWPAWRASRVDPMVALREN